MKLLRIMVIVLKMKAMAFSQAVFASIMPHKSITTILKIREFDEEVIRLSSYISY